MRAQGVELDAVYTGFENIGGMTVLSYGFPYKEAPKTYIRKLTLAPSVEAFQLLRKGDSITLTWELSEIDAADFREGLTAIISVKVAEPQFEGQTKTKLGNSEVTAAVSQATSAALENYLDPQ